VGVGVLLSEPVAEAPAAVTVGEAVGVGVLLSETVAEAAGVGDSVALPPPKHVVTLTSVDSPCVSASQPVLFCVEGLGWRQLGALNVVAVKLPPPALPPELHVTRALGGGPPPGCETR
jgi:hypothetical protein